MPNRLRDILALVSNKSSLQDNTRTTLTGFRSYTNALTTPEPTFKPMQVNSYKFDRLGLDTLKFFPADTIDDVCQKLLGKTSNAMMEGCTWQYPPTNKQILNGKIIDRGPSITYLNEDWKKGDLQNGKNHENDHKRIVTAKQAIFFALKKRQDEHKTIPSEKQILFFQNRLSKIDSLLDANEHAEYNKEGGVTLQRNSNVSKDVQKVLDDFNQLLKRIDND